MNTRNGSKHHKIEIVLKIFAMFLEVLQRIPVKSKGFIIELAKVLTLPVIPSQMHPQLSVI